MAITIKNSRELAAMRRAGRIVAESHVLLRNAVRPGVTTQQLNDLVLQHIERHGGKPSFLGYGNPPFPAATCISVNDQVVHGIPGPLVLKDGDIVSVDIGVYIDGYHADSAWSYAVGSISPQAQALLEGTEATLYYALGMARAGNRLSDIAHALQSFAEGRGLHVVRKYISHGIGRALHEDPQMLNYGPPGRGPLLRAGMTLAIEPMIAVGSYETLQLDDGWTVVTADGSLAAHYEHTIVISAEGEPEILTRQE